MFKLVSSCPIFQLRIFFLVNMMFYKTKFQLFSTYHFNMKIGHTYLNYFHKISYKSKTINTVVLNIKYDNPDYSK